MTGAEVARQMLDQSGLRNIKIEQISGTLSDHYDPSSKTLRLSQAVYGTSSVAAAGVAAHETGHAIQDATNYSPLKLRSHDGSDCKNWVVGWSNCFHGWACFFIS